jgi:hypothetical protein
MRFRITSLRDAYLEINGFSYLFSHFLGEKVIEKYIDNNPYSFVKKYISLYFILRTEEEVIIHTTFLKCLSGRSVSD